MAEKSYKSNLIQKRKRPVFMGKYVKAGFFSEKWLSKNFCGVFEGRKERIALLLEEIYG